MLRGLFLFILMLVANVSAHASDMRTIVKAMTVLPVPYGLRTFDVGAFHGRLVRARHASETSGDYDVYMVLMPHGSMWDVVAFDDGTRHEDTLTEVFHTGEDALSRVVFLKPPSDSPERRMTLYALTARRATPDHADTDGLDAPSPVRFTLFALTEDPAFSLPMLTVVAEQQPNALYRDAGQAVEAELGLRLPAVMTR